MNIDKIKELVRLFHRVDYKDLFGALIVYDNIDYLGELEDVDTGDIEYLEGLYDYYMDSDINLLNTEELHDMYNEYLEIEGE